MSLQQLLHYLSQELGIQPLRLNGNGVCQFTVDDGVVVNIEDSPLERCAHVYATIASVLETQREEVFAKLLEAQLFGREMGDALAFGYDREVGEILLCRRLRVETIEPDAFADALNEFITWAEHWQNKLAQFTSYSADYTADLPEHFIRA